MTVKTRRWWRGVLAAIIGGGAHAVTPTGIVTIVDPKQFSPISNLVHFLLLAGSTFVASGIAEMFRYLGNNPLPDEDPDQPVAAVTVPATPTETKT